MAVTQRSSDRFVAAKGPRGLRDRGELPVLRAQPGRRASLARPDPRATRGKLNAPPRSPRFPAAIPRRVHGMSNAKLDPKSQGELIQAPVSLPIPLAKPLLASELRLQRLEPEQRPNAQCPDSLTKPTAARGDLCLYSEEIGEGTILARVERTAHSCTSGIVLQFFLEPVEPVTELGR
jgi:hypothetical protein